MNKEQTQIPLGIVIPVLNEEKTLPRLLETLASQTKTQKIACLAIVDGSSTDNSKKIASSWQPILPELQVLDNPKRITPIAFNIGIKACLEAGAETVTLLGAHSWVADDFFICLDEAINRNNADIIGAVHRYSKPNTSFDRAIQAFSESRLGRRLKYFTNLKKPTPTSLAFSPTIRRIVFENIGLFDENMARNQDNDFTSRALNAGFRIVSDPSLRYTYVPRRDLKSLLKQMYGNGFGVGLKPNVHGLKHFAPSLFWLIIFLMMIATYLLQLPALLTVGPIILVYLAAIFAETLLWGLEIGIAAVWLPILFILGHFAYAWGSFVGFLSHLRINGGKT